MCKIHTQWDWVHVTCAAIWQLSRWTVSEALAPFSVLLSVCYTGGYRICSSFPTSHSLEPRAPLRMRASIRTAQGHRHTACWLTDTTSTVRGTISEKNKAVEGHGFQDLFSPCTLSHEEYEYSEIREHKQTNFVWFIPFYFSCAHLDLSGQLIKRKISPGKNAGLCLTWPLNVIGLIFHLKNPSQWYL